MKINVASTNPVKVNALLELASEYELIKSADIKGLSVPSGVSDQPKSLEETITGSKNRALAAFKDCDLSFGIESGLMDVPHTKTGCMDVCVCTIYDGKTFHIGLSSAFECPPEVVRLMRDEGLDMSQAINKIGMTNDTKIGSAHGAIGILTKGRVTRLDYTKQAITMAMIHLEQSHLYQTT